MQIDMLLELDYLPARNLLYFKALSPSLSLFRHLCPTRSPTSSPHLPACTHQYSKGATVGFRHIGGAAQISVLILMGKGLRVQLQVTLRVAQEVGGWGRALGSDDTTGMAMMREIMGCFTGSKRGEEKGDVESLWWCCLVRLPMCTNRHLCTGESVLDAKSFPQHTYSWTKQPCPAYMHTNEKRVIPCTCGVWRHVLIHHRQRKLHKSKCLRCKHRRC